MKKEYTAEETAKFKAERNQKLREERAARRPQLIWDSKKQGTFTGSLSKEFLDIKPEFVTEAETTEAKE